MTETTLFLDEVYDLAKTALVKAGASETAAASVATSTWRAERDGIRSHGLMYVPIYAEHVRCGKVIGTAEPQVTHVSAGSVRVDAGYGFAHPAIQTLFDIEKAESFLSNHYGSIFATVE